MSYTFPVIPIGRDETDRRIENVVNRIQRHCKIGKVTPAIYRPSTVPNVLPTSWPFMDGPVTPSPQYMNKCGCKVGSACNNVACPHRLVATC